MSGVRVIGIGGGTGSGKSTIADALAQHLGAVVVRVDDYYHPLDHMTFEEREKVNFDAPCSIDHELLHTHLKQLIAGEPVDRPSYDFSRHTRFVFGEQVAPHPVIIVEGLFALHWPEINQLYQTSIFVEAPRDVRFARRLQRDIEQRGRDAAEVTFRFNSHVNPMHDLHVQPTIHHADLVVYGDHDFDATFESAMSHVAASGPVVR